MFLIESGFICKELSQEKEMKPRIPLFALTRQNIFVFTFLFAVLILVFLLEPPISANLNNANMPAFLNKTNPLGCDRLGRDNLSLLVYGIFSAFALCLPARFFTLFFSFSIAGLEFLLPSVFGFFFNSLASVFLSLPSLLIALIVISVLPGQVWSILLAMVLADWAIAYEVIQGKVKELKGSGYMQASYSMGASRSQVFVFHVLPSLQNLSQYLFLTGIPSVIMTLALFSYLGINLDFLDWGPGLGEQIAFSKDYFEKNWISVLLPILGIVFTVYSVSGLGSKSK